MTPFDDAQVAVDVVLAGAIVWLGRLLWLAQKVREGIRGQHARDDDAGT